LGVGVVVVQNEKGGRLRPPPDRSGEFGVEGR
jgi:hypothetical protein